MYYFLRCVCRRFGVEVSRMFIRKHVVSVGSVVFLQCTHGGRTPPLFNRDLSSRPCLHSPKRRSPYSLEYSERYSALVKSAMNSRVSAQNPENLQAEDEHLYGRIVKAQMPSVEPQGTEPEPLHPFLLSETNEDSEEPETGSPVRIAFKRDPKRSSVPSVTRILQQTLSPEQIFYLERWKKGMIAELGEDGFKKYTQNLFRQGKLFHSAVDGFLTSLEPRNDTPSSENADHPPEIQGYMQSISHILEDVSAARAIESTVQHDTLNYLGIVDCVARYRGVLCVIDWKTSEKQKPLLRNTYDNPIQVAAYAGALNSDCNYNFQVENGLIVVAYKDGSPGHAHEIESDRMQQYWKSWLLRLEKYREQR